MSERHWIGRRAARRRLLPTLVAPLMIAGGLTALGPVAVASAACVRVTGLEPPSPGTSADELAGVASFNGCDAWAVGAVDRATFIEHWDGESWSRVSSPAPGTTSSLTGVSVISPANAWAVGESATSSGDQTLIEHWDGSSWSVVPSPSPGSSDSTLSAVAGASASSVWAVGEFFSVSSRTDQALIEHWDGSSWSVVPNPTSSASVVSLTGVAVTSASNAWAVGSISAGSGQQQTLIEHWDGSSWSVVPSPSPGTVANPLLSVTAASATDAWAVGFSSGSSGLTQPLIEHWDGTSWTLSSPPAAPSGTGEALIGVTANGTRNAFAVGATLAVAGSTEIQRPVLLRWDGSSWTQLTTPSPGTGNAVLVAVSASSQDVWMTGDFNTDTTPTLALALHCC